MKFATQISPLLNFIMFSDFVNVRFVMTTSSVLISQVDERLSKRNDLLKSQLPQLSKLSQLSKQNLNALVSLTYCHYYR